MYQGLQTSKTSNQIKTWLLILLFPLLLGGAIFVVFYFIAKNVESSQMQVDFALQSTLEFMPMLLIGLAIWMVIAFFFQRQLMFAFSWAKVVTRTQEPELYNLIENLCISRGLPVPKIGIIEEAGMNAFALGRRASDSRVVFTRGLLHNLEKREIEAVAAHELTHIINKDSLLMLVMVLYIGAISIAGEMLIRFGGRSSSSDEKKGNPLPLIGFALIILGYIAYPLIRLAISRRREFLADAGAVEITKDNQAMISALRKISQKPDLDLDNKEMASMFSANPLGKISSLFQTHPSIEERIEALKHY